MKSRPFPKLAALLPVLMFGAPHVAAADGAPAVTLSARAQTRLGIRTQPAAAVQLSPQVPALGRVLSPQHWLSMNADLAAAGATASAAAAEAQRLRRLYAQGRNVALKAVQAAAAQDRIDRLRHSRLRQQLRLDWGPALAGLSAAQRARLSDRLARGDSVLVRADAPTASPGTILSGATLRSLQGGAAIPAVVLEPAPSVDPVLQAPAWLLQVEGAHARALRPGEALRIWLQAAGPAQSAIQVPESAIVRIAGRPYAYVRTAPEHFEQRALTLLAPDGDGWAAAADIAPGAALVAAGADALWWASQAPPAVAGKPAGPMHGDGDDD